MNQFISLQERHTSLQERFTNKNNMNLLWNVLLDEFQLNNSSKKTINDVKYVFEINIQPFITRANPNLNIMELNKQFLSQIVLAVNKLFPNFKHGKPEQQYNQEQIKKITIYPDEVSEPYKIEDIQASRQNEFDKNVEQKRIDMEKYMIPQKPKEVDFSDRNTDNKITSMDSLIAEKMAQRNLEIEQLQQLNYETTNTENWLTPKETSVKNEKIIFEKNNKNDNKNNENNRLKHISIDSNNNITLSINEPEQNKNSSKKVSWNDSVDKKETTVNIFNKLKKQPVIERNHYDETNNINIVIDDTKQYAEQQSMPLPNIKQEEIIRNQSTLSTSNNEPILPKTEIIKQLNDMNKKIDNLYEMVFKLTSFIEQKNNGTSLELGETIE
jgi:hypothetical protein